MMNIDDVTVKDFGVQETYDWVEDDGSVELYDAYHWRLQYETGNGLLESWCKIPSDGLDNITSLKDRAAYIRENLKSHARGMKLSNFNVRIAG